MPISQTIRSEPLLKSWPKRWGVDLEIH
ncbi:hypothetical protein RB2654_14260 [Rhodobacterales bacterium HTCC2654]|uniref:Uncharacterized protein n=1 Tax=Maritimibacter alkaliphilus HTCC2654 TaxID=314271 RepID=A3VGQ1_9RHOB|nr:hypothetical protein RB2654_14260 [Rhodobacterales bacterium HTCC2654] [Maritimibacter alkaliphilus HTCC2654]